MDFSYISQTANSISHYLIVLLAINAAENLKKVRGTFAHIQSNEY